MFPVLPRFSRSSTSEQKTGEAWERGYVVPSCTQDIPSCCSCMLCPHVMSSCCALMLCPHVPSCALMLCPNVVFSCCALMLRHPHRVVSLTQWKVLNAVKFDTNHTRLLARNEPCNFYCTSSNFSNCFKPRKLFLVLDKYK